MPVHVFGKLFERIIAVAVALDSQPLAVAFDHQIDAERSNLPVRSNAIAGRGQALHHFSFEVGLRPLFLLLQDTHETSRIFRMLNQLAAKVVRFQVNVRAEGVNDPHLVACAAGSDIETLFEKFLIAQRERAAFSCIDQRNENHVALVTLELRGVSAQHPMEFVAVGRNVRANQVIDFDGLLVAHQRNHSEAQRLPRVVLLIFGLLHRGRKQRGDGDSFLAIDLAVAVGPRDAMRNGVRPEVDAAGIA